MNSKRAQIIQQLFNQSDRLTLDNPIYKQWVFRYTFLELEKDLNEHGDIKTDGLLHEKKQAVARIYTNQKGIMCGSEEISYFVMTSDPIFRPRLNTIKITKCLNDGKEFGKDDVLFEMKGDAKDILKVERTVLNFLQHICGIATNAKKIIDKIKKDNPNVLIVPTRKTTWGLVDKKAVTVAGGGTHRLNLADAVLIKDNHLALFNHDIKKVLRDFHPPTSPYQFFEIEIDKKDEVLNAAKIMRELQQNKALPDPAVIMFDNMKPKDIQDLISQLKKESLYDHFLFEASGGINEKNIDQYAKTEIDIISLGALTQKLEPINLSLEIGT
jgi:nicotinate-nucleotide pyrophosphorylase (carboxylating)